MKHQKRIFLNYLFLLILFILSLSLSFALSLGCFYRKSLKSFHVSTTPRHPALPLILHRWITISLQPQPDFSTLLNICTQRVTLKGDLQPLTAKFPSAFTHNISTRNTWAPLDHPTENVEAELLTRPNLETLTSPCSKNNHVQCKTYSPHPLRSNPQWTSYHHQAFCLTQWSTTCNGHHKLPLLLILG